MIETNTDDPAYLLKLHKNLMIMIVILSSFVIIHSHFAYRLKKYYIKLDLTVLYSYLKKKR